MPSWGGGWVSVSRPSSSKRSRMYTYITPDGIIPPLDVQWTRRRLHISRFCDGIAWREQWDLSTNPGDSSRSRVRPSVGFVRSPTESALRPWNRAVALNIKKMIVGKRSTSFFGNMSSRTLTSRFQIPNIIATFYECREWPRNEMTKT